MGQDEWTNNGETIKLGNDETRIGNKYNNSR